MSLSRILSIARSALAAHQWAMNVTANNIANANTPGYTRRRAVLEGGASGLAGVLDSLGVHSSGIERIRDRYLDAAFRRESASVGSSGTMRYFMEQVEGVLGEPSDTGVAASLDALFRAFGDLATDPADPVGREEVRRSARFFASRLRNLEASLRDMASEAQERLGAEIAEVNDLSRAIASINGRIQSAADAGGASSELLDERDMLLDRLSERHAIQVVEMENGSVTVLAAGVTLVTGTDFEELEVKAVEGGGYGFGLASSGDPLAVSSGTLNALSSLTAVTIPDLLAKLDTFAEAVVTQINALHRTGHDANGNTGVDFFDPEGITAGSIRLSEAVEGSADAIAAGGGAGAGDNTVALELAALAEKGIDALGGQSLSRYFNGFASSIGRMVSDARQDETASLALLSHVEMNRQSVSGVSIDEEMVMLVDQQEAYMAAARLVSTADRMMQEVLQLLR